MTEQKQLNPVSFHGDTIYAVEHQGEPYAPMRPIIENMGLAWPPQREKLSKQADRWGVTIIVTPSSGGLQETVCIPVRKLAGFLATINHNKVRNELRSKVLAYQRECDDVLWQYWTGQDIGGGRRKEDFAGDFENLDDVAVSPSQRIRLLSLAIRFAGMSPAEKQAALEYYGSFCREAGKARAKNGNRNAGRRPEIPEHVELFISSRCSVEPGLQETKDAVYGAYCSFCHQNNATPLPPMLFFKHLYSVTDAKSVKVRRKPGNKRVQAIAGLGLV